MNLQEFIDKLYAAGWTAPNDAQHENIKAVFDATQERANALDALINNPQTDEFLGAVKAEAAHQVERWGAAHDRSKSAENWFWLVGYLSGKALRAAISGDTHKALHHTISSGAALANWFAAIKRDETSQGIGRDNDIKSPSSREHLVNHIERIVQASAGDPLLLQEEIKKAGEAAGVV